MTYPLHRSVNVNGVDVVLQDITLLDCWFNWAHAHFIRMHGCPPDRAEMLMTRTSLPQMVAAFPLLFDPPGFRFRGLRLEFPERSASVGDVELELTNTDRTRWLACQRGLDRVIR